MRRIRLYFIVILGLPLILNAFMSGYVPGGFGWHGKITSRALEESGFSRKAIREIRKANAMQDWDLIPLRIIDHKRHFGRDFSQLHEEAFRRNKAYLEWERSRFLEVLADSAPSYREARRILGYCTHTVQDAFSHSNYWEMSEADQEMFMNAIVYPDSGPPPGAKIVCSGSDDSDEYAYGHLDHGKDSPCTPEGKEAFYISVEAAARATKGFIEASRLMLAERLGEVQSSECWDRLLCN